MIDVDLVDGVCVVHKHEQLFVTSRIPLCRNSLLGSRIQIPLSPLIFSHANV